MAKRLTVRINVATCTDTAEMAKPRRPYMRYESA